MSSSGRRKLHLRRPVVVDTGCNCLKSRLASLFPSFSNEPRPKPQPQRTDLSTITTTIASSSTTDPSFTTDSDAPLPSQQQRRAGSRKNRRRSGRVARESVAVVKETWEPYSEFKESMVQMIVEKEIYGWDDLNDLLHRFLSLNSPRHHHLILRAFADLWSGGVLDLSPPSRLAAGYQQLYAAPPPRRRPTTTRNIIR